MAKKKGGPVTKAKAEKIKAEIRELILSGKNKYTNTELESKFKVSRQTISNYIKEAYESVPEDDMNTIYLEIKVIYERMHRRLLELWDKTVEDNQYALEVKILKEIRDTIKDFTEMLERYFKKAKPVENMNINEVKDNKFVVEIVETKQVKEIEVEVKG